MACASQFMISARTCGVFTSGKNLLNTKRSCTFNRIRASSSSSEEDCNVEECAPDKETMFLLEFWYTKDVFVRDIHHFYCLKVGKVSMEWLAGEKTRVVGTFPPTGTKKGWTGYVEKDTAGQTNIYAVEPSIYVAEGAISSGTSGTSSDGAENTVAIAAGIALIFVSVASSILLQVGKNPPPVENLEYSGPSLSYYIDKFTPAEIIEASIVIPTEDSSSIVIQLESSVPEVSQLQVE
ncbi:hypothetical protein GIB67_023155 [Kingdonia uniflora]|uniref:Uncharacterized protein n=1 Tax=Kingdonia uniflora TaxID=39325 RepID=A0A7J7M5W5_9MAGN|nr:hypothetical protein GIB67_023155 [Kingdonia uniflora]